MEVKAVVTSCSRNKLHQTIYRERCTKWCTKLVKKDPGKARQSR